MLPFKDVSGTTAKFKMELFVTNVSGFQPLTFVTKSSSLDFAVVLDTPLLFSLLIINSENTINDHHNFRIDSDKDDKARKIKIN